MTTELRISEIRTDGGTQPRAQLNLTTVDEYAESILDGATFPPVEVMYDGSEYWLWDGFHRVESHKKACCPTIRVNVKQGTRRDAVLASVGANNSHGLQRTREDKRRAVMTLLNDAEWAKWSDREIARQCKVGHQLVGQMRQELHLDDHPDQTFDSKSWNYRNFNRNGKTYEMGIPNIGKTVTPPIGTVPLKPKLAGEVLSQPSPASAFVSPRPLGEVVRSETRFAPAPPIRDDEEFDDTEDDTEDMDTSTTRRFGHDWATVSGPAGSYRQNGDTKFCEKCKSLWAADLPYCPYCNISPEARAYEAQQQKNKLRLAAANHAVSDDPDYDGDEWYTPAEIIESARLVMGSIDLDPATCEEAQKVVGAEKFYTKDDDSLRDDICWYGNVWLNPPYSAKLIIQFIEKLIAEYDNGNIAQAIVITNNSSETDWFQDLLERFPTCFKRRRAKFWRPNTDVLGARQGQAIFYLGDNVDKFCDEFSKMGVVVSKHDNQ